MIRTRMAPSPTGNLHIGTARTTLFNWLFARKNKGEFLLRIEDTDLERSKPEYEKDVIDGLRWLGLGCDNKEIIRQSERLNIYEAYLKKLLSSSKAFWCEHTKEELEEESKKQRAKSKSPRHICSHKKEKRNSGQIIRLSVDENSDKKIRFQDVIRGKIEFEENLMGDFSLAKDLQTPLYNFAVVADDIDMEISHVIRGEDHISNTPKQLLIYEALGMNPPIFAHLPLILGADRSKMSKRHGETSINEYKKDYLPEVMINFMGFLGYTYGKEIISKEEMVQELELEKVHKSGAIFDAKKLNWINSQYIKKLSPQEFKNLANVPNLPNEAVSLVTERLEKLTDVSNFDYFWKSPDYDSELLKWKKFSLKDSKKSLEQVEKIVSSHNFKNKDEIRSKLDDLAKEIGDRGLVYWPFRVALTGRDKSPDPVDVAYVLGKEKTLERVRLALE